MPNKLTAEQIERYHRDGFLFPVDVMPAREAAELLRRLEEAEALYPEALDPRHRNNPHIAFTCLDEIVHHPALLDAVEDLIGPDILAWGTVLFAKDAGSKGFVSWHQDYTYMGLEPHEGVSAWLALTPSTVRSGCMRMLPGTHGRGVLAHRDTFGEDNILTRGQTIDDLDESLAVDLVLEPGQMSLHHPRTVHGSTPNTSAGRRVGFTIQSYIPPHVRQVKCESHATLVRGRDSSGHFEPVPRPRRDMAPEAAALRAHINRVREEVLYEGTSGARRF